MHALRLTKEDAMQQRGKAPRIRPAPCIPIVDSPSAVGAAAVRVQGVFVVVFMDVSYGIFPNGALRREWT